MINTNIFSSKFFATIALALLVVFQSCKKNDVAEVAPAAAQNDNIAALTQSVAASFDLSADKVSYNKNEKEFIIDGDATVSLEDATARFSSNGVAGAANAATQKKNNYVVASAKVNTIKIFADATVPAAWVAALDSAIATWNASGSKVNMQRITTSTGATTTITTTYATTNVIASASYPDAFGGVGRKVIVNTYYNSLAVTAKVSTITHEIGHTLGLMHTNEAYGTLIAGTPSLDAASIMNSTGLTITTLSTSDLTAIKALYPPLR